MPQIAQQDYIVIKPKEGRNAINDAECLRRLKLACENGTIFDCLIKDAFEEDAGTTRVLGIYSTVVGVYDVVHEAISSINLPYTVEQYSGLAAVQEAVDESGGVVIGDIPLLETAEQDGVAYLAETYNSDFVCCNGYLIKPTIDDDIFVAFELTNIKPAEGVGFVNIAWEDVIKLIGLPN